MKKAFLALIIAGLCVFCAVAQTVDEDDNLSWNDIQVTIPVNKELDFFLQGTMRFGNDISRLNEHRAGAGFVYKPSKAWSVQSSYVHINVRNSKGKFRPENRLALRIGYQFPIKKFELFHRSMFERRFRAPQNSWRYRSSLTVEKSIKSFISGTKLFVTEEVFYDSIVGKFSRNRLSAGVIKKLTEKLSLDIYYLRQNDGYARPGDLNVIGTSWKYKF